MNEFLPMMGSILTGFDNNTADQQTDDGTNFLFELENAVQHDVKSALDDQAIAEQSLLEQPLFYPTEWQESPVSTETTQFIDIEQQRNDVAIRGNSVPLEEIIGIEQASVEELNVPIHENLASVIKRQQPMAREAIVSVERQMIFLSSFLALKMRIQF